MPPPILVVGRKGQLATDLAELPGVVAFGRPDLDVTDEASVRVAIERTAPCAVINAAAYTAVDRAESEPEAAFALNEAGPRHLALACTAANVPFVHVSTDQVFDGARPGGYREEDTPNPLCLYGRSKLAGERAVAEAGGRSLVVRVSWVFGPSGDNFVKKVLAWASERGEIRVVCDQRGRPTYSPALAGALLRLAREMAEGRGPEGVLHLAGASVMSRFEQARMVLEAAGARGGPAARVRPVLTRNFPTPAVRPLNAELDVSRAAAMGVRLSPFAGDLRRTLDRVLPGS
jgi:dTDP-4-dehydrorhamnose reductase